MRAYCANTLLLSIGGFFGFPVVVTNMPSRTLSETHSLHNVADALTAMPLLIAFRLGRRRPNTRFTYGYGRAEDLAGLFVIATITLSAVLAGYETIGRLHLSAPCPRPRQGRARRRH